MWRFEAGLLCCLCVAAILLPPCTLAGNESKYGQKCEIDGLGNPPCGTNERCKQDTVDRGLNITKCQCVLGYEYNKIANECLKTTPTEPRIVTTPTATAKSISSTSEGGSSVAAILLIPTCLILIGALGYFGARRYKWIQRFRQFRQNRYGSVLVTRDDTDDDDPPIA